MREEEVVLAWNGLTLVGTLHLPQSQGTHPVVVMIQGSGPSDRTSNGYFPLIRDAFVAKGIGAFAFDKPGCGESTGDWRDYALAARADQVLIALDTLRDHPMVRPDQIGLWGQSQGGWLVQMLAGSLPDIPFAIANSGPSITVRDQDLYGCQHSMHAKGHPQADIDLALDFVTNIHHAAEKHIPYETVDSQLLEPARKQRWYGYMTITDSEDWMSVCSFVQEEFDPILAMCKIRSPYLAIYGGQDVLLPAWRSARESAEALQEAGNPDTTIVVFPQGNHRIIDVTSGGFATGYLDLLGDWTARRTSLSDTSFGSGA